MRPEDAKHHPMISVVIPTYNSGEFILRTLSSVLAQTYRDFEIVVSDDGSTDGTLDAVRTFLGGFPGISWRLVENSHGGPGAARNAGILAASGEWVAFLDSDDVWFPEKLSCVVAFIGLHPEARLLCHDVLWLYHDGTARVVRYHRFLKANRDPFLALFRRNILATSAVSVKRSLLLHAGLFDPSLPNNQDYDLWLRLSKKCRPLYLTNVLTLYRPREGSQSTNHLRRLTCMLRIGDKYSSDLNGRVRWPAYERRRFLCRAYLSSAKSLLLSSNLRAGTRLAMKAAAAWLPARQQ
jgi:glycosyltransferase involved in cell wall biosynthesis